MKNIFNYWKIFLTNSNSLYNLLSSISPVKNWTCNKDQIKPNWFSTKFDSKTHCYNLESRSNKRVIYYLILKYYLNLFFFININLILFSIFLLFLLILMKWSHLYKSAPSLCIQMGSHCFIFWLYFSYFSSNHFIYFISFICTRLCHFFKHPNFTIHFQSLNGLICLYFDSIYLYSYSMMHISPYLFNNSHWKFGKYWINNLHFSISFILFGVLVINFFIINIIKSIFFIN